MPYEPPPQLAGMTLAQIAEQVELRKLPPVEGWAPQSEGDSRMEIRPDGTWLHDGGPIRREAMVRAFAGLLTRDEDGRHWLVTPFEKLRIAVADAALVAVDAARVEGDIAIRLNTDELLVVGPDHPLRIAGSEDEPAAYVAVRRGIEARLNRSTWLQLVELALAEGEGAFVTSKGERFALTA